MVLPPDHGKTLDAFRAGKTDFLEQQKRDLLQEAGGLAAAGNMAGAKNKLYSGGNFAEAGNMSQEMRAQSAEARAIQSHARSLDDQNLAKFAKSQELLGNMGSAILKSSNPEQALNQAKTILAQRGLKVGDITIDQLPMLMQQNISAQEALKLEFQERQVKAEEGRALAASQKNELVPVAPGTTLYDQRARAPAFTAPEKPQAVYDFTKTGVGNKHTGEFKPYAEGENVDPEAQVELGKYEQGLRKEWTSLTADNRAANDSINRMRLAGKDNTGAGDVAMIYSYMKMLDPNAAVMEGDYAKASNTGGIPGAVVNLYNRAVNGSFLTPEQRSNFLRMGENVAKDRNSRFQKARSQFSNAVKSGGADPARVMLDEGEGETATPDAAGGNQAAPPEAIQMLKQNPTPEYRASFDKWFGKDASKQILGN